MTGALVGFFVGAAAAVLMMKSWKRQTLPTRPAVELAPEGPSELSGAKRALDEISTVLGRLATSNRASHGSKGMPTPVSRQAVDMIEGELLLLSNKINSMLSESTINALPLALLLQKGRGQAPICAVDLGGTLNKVILLADPNQPFVAPPTAVHHTPPLPITMGKLSLHLVCIAFPSSRIGDVTDFLQSLIGEKARGNKGVITLHATGGGGHKYEKVLEEKLGVKVKFVDEMRSVITGTNYRLLTGTAEAFCYKWGIDSDAQLKGYVNFKGLKTPFPYLLVNIGSGVSILRVDEGSYKRISGSCLGGGSFFGLCRLLTGKSDFKDFIALSKKGDISKTDLLVSDIYGAGFCRSLGLAEDLIASSFGKVANAEGEPKESVREEDMVRSLLFMFTNNISQIASLLAEREGIEHIIFTGGFIRDNKYVWSKITFGLDYWSGGKLQALFMEHEGYNGALGAYLLSDG